MKNEKNFYDIISSKFNERETPFDETNWKAMKEIIDASRSDKKRLLWLVASLSLLLCAGGAFAIYQWNNKGDQSKTLFANTTINSPSKTIAANNEQSAANLTGVNKTTTINNTTPANNETSIHSVNTNNPSANQTQTSSNKQNIAAVSVNKKTIKNRRHHTSANNERTVGPNMLASNNISSPNATAESKLTPDNQQNSLTPGKNDPSGHNPVSNKTAQSPNPATAKTTASVTGKTSIRKTDSIAAANVLPQRFSNEPRIFLGKTNLFSVDAAIEYSGGWEEGFTTQGKGINVTAGVGYSHYLGGRTFLKTGLLFSTFGNMSPLTFNYQHSVGRMIYDSVITTQRLYFLKLPVQLEYFVGRNKKSSVGIGGTLWYLVGSTGYATTYQQEDNNPPTNVVKYAANAPLAGYNKVNASFQFFYRYVLSHKFSVYVIPYFELTNMKNSSFFGEKIIERTHGLQAMLSYNLN